MAHRYEFCRLFLIPLPWWGPVLSPVLIALLLVIGGTLVSQFDRPERPIWPGWKAWVVNLSGVALALYVFMADAVQLASHGADAVRQSLPTYFNWPLFVLALILLAVPIFQVLGQIDRHRQQRPEAATVVIAE
jgi:hypothetical protein